MYALCSAILLIALSLAVPDANTSLFIYDKLFANESRLQNKFSGKRIWITGASSGIGEELAKQLYKYGANLIISGRRESELNRVKSLCEGSIDNNRSSAKNPNNIAVLAFDVTDSDEMISEIATNASDNFNGIDILILNAGAGQLTPAVDASFSNTRKLMEVNYMGPVRVAMEVLKNEKWDTQQGGEKGHIVVTSSVASKMALPLGTSYAASKFAVHGYFTSLRSECAQWLRIDLPCPGPIATAFHDKAIDMKKTSDSNENDDDSELKMPVERCAKLIISGMLGPEMLMQETWISRQPALAFLYLNRNFPRICNSLLCLIGPLRIKAFREGLPLYKVSSWVKVAGMEKERKQSSQNEND